MSFFQSLFQVKHLIDKAGWMIDPVYCHERVSQVVEEAPSLDSHAKILVIVNRDHVALSELIAHSHFFVLRDQKHSAIR